MKQLANVCYEGEPDRIGLTKGSIVESLQEPPLKIFVDGFGLIDIDDE